MNLVASRNKWRKEYESGAVPVWPDFEEYKLNRESEMWRSGSVAERFYEYVLYLEEKANESTSKEQAS